MGIYKQERFGIARKIVSNMTAESWETIPHAVCGYGQCFHAAECSGPNIEG